MEFEWDPAKAEVNLRKHGVSFPFAAGVFLDLHHLERRDSQTGDGEDRWIVVGLVNDFEVAVVYTLRGDRIRIISARRADTYERESYWHGSFPS